MYWHRVACGGMAVQWRDKGETPQFSRPFSQFPSSRCVQAANSDSNFLAGEKQRSPEVRLKGPTLKQTDRGDPAVVQELHRRTDPYRPTATILGI